MDEHGGPPRSAAEIMHTDVVTIGDDASLPELADLLREHAISGVPVTDRDGRAVGTVSVTDLLWLSDRVQPTVTALRETGRWEGLERLTVRDIMTPDVFGVAPDCQLDELLAFFSRTGLHRALVLEGERVVGVISATDLLELIARDGSRELTPPKGRR
jgi:CBS-domain-containing membrane protein